MTRDLPLVDMAAEPHLRGRFAPVAHEVVQDDLVIEGTLPANLTGTYMRNGPNPRFPPLGSYTYPIEGDGMLHAVTIDNGRARYRNQWVYTNSLRAELAAGKALFGGIMTLALPDMSLLGSDPDPGWPIKLDPFINIIRHAGRYLALEEGTPPYEVTAELNTVGRFDFNGGLPAGICAHPRIDPRTGEMVVFRYDAEAPFLAWATIGPDGTVTRPATTVDTVEACYMIHDFTITEHFVVLVVAPATIDVTAMFGGGGTPLRWEADRPTRIAIIDRDGSRTRWIETEPFFAWHYANAYEDDDEIILDFPWWSAFTLATPRGQPSQAGFVRARLRPATGTATFDFLDHTASEFPRINDRLTTKHHRYITTSRKSGRHDLEVGEYDQVVRHDLDSGTTATYNSDLIFGEVSFAPRDGATEELDGYYLTYATTLDAKHSWLLVWDATTFPSDPIARIAIPQRVPNGLHGNWFQPDS
jgi:carotenoid cleavage dioxygenase-like enzyme